MGTIPVVQQQTQPFEHFVDTAVAAKFIGIQSRALQNLARAGTVPAYPLGEGPRKTWRFLLSEISSWMHDRGRKIQ
jgi:hypothetical protein